MSESKKSPRKFKKNLFLLVVDYVTSCWAKSKDNQNGQQIRHLAAFYVDMMTENARLNDQDKDSHKQEALSVLKVLCF